MQFDKEKSTNLFKDGDETSTDKAATLLTNEPGILKEGAGNQELGVEVRPKAQWYKVQIHFL